jgi:hypothetical protein
VERWQCSQVIACSALQEKHRERVDARLHINKDCSEQRWIALDERREYVELWWIGCYWMLRESLGKHWF